MQFLLEQGIQITAVNADVVGNICDSDRSTVIVSNELCGPTDILAAGHGSGSQEYIQILCQQAEKGI